jgi:hypothetical protein
VRFATDFLPRIGSADEPSTSPQGIPLWQLRGALEELACIARPTSWGYALGLELGGDLILLELQPNVETLVENAARLEAWLITQGWVRTVQIEPLSAKEH